MEYLTELLIVIITTIIAPFVLAYLQSRTADQRLKTALADLQGSVDTAAAAFNIAFKSEKNNLSADGIFDKEDYQKALAVAVAAARETLLPSTILYLQKNNINILQLLQDKITVKVEGKNG